MSTLLFFGCSVGTGLIQSFVDSVKIDEITVFVFLRHRLEFKPYFGETHRYYAASGECVCVFFSFFSFVSFELSKPLTVCVAYCDRSGCASSRTMNI